MHETLGWPCWFALCLRSSAAQAQDKYPSKPMKILVPYGAGRRDRHHHAHRRRSAAADPRPAVSWSRTSRARSASSRSRKWPARKPDGYTLMVGNVTTNAITPVLFKKKFTIDYEKDVVAVARLADLAVFLDRRPPRTSTPKTIAELVDYAKKSARQGPLYQRRRRQLPALRHGDLRAARRRRR